MRWGMVVDLRKCIGCGACEIACWQTNGLPSNLWRQVFDCGVSGSPERQRAFLPINCMHCSEPPCEKVCPTTATYRRPDGIVDIDYDLCIGCGYCVVACPYLARVIIARNAYGFAMGHRLHVPGQVIPNPDHTDVCTKCNFCQARVEAGLEKGLRPGLDAEATPACVAICSTHTMHFGDLDDPDSNVSRLIRENKTSCLQGGLGTDPAVHYIVE